MECSSSYLLLPVLISMATASVTPFASDITEHHHTNFTNTEELNRQKRFIAYNYDERRITFPPGTIFILTPTFAVPFFRNLRKGFGSDMTISTPFKMSFDDFGWTDEFNPWGVVPGISIPSGRETDTGPSAPRENEEGNRRYKRSRDTYNPHPLGDRLVLFEIIEDYLMNLGHNGKACLLRAICETNEHPLPYHGLFGEFLQMLFNVSVMPFAEDIMVEYIEAEKAGKERAYCRHYAKECPISLFSTVTENKSRKAASIEKINERISNFGSLQNMDWTNTIR